MDPACNHFEDGWIEIWRALYALAEISKKEPTVREALQHGETGKLIEYTVNTFAAAAAPANKPFVFPHKWTVVVAENVKYFLMVPDSSKGLTIYYPLPRVTSGGPLDHIKEPAGGGDVFDRIKAWLAQPRSIGPANRSGRDELIDASAACSYGCHSETSPIWDDAVNRAGSGTTQPVPPGNVGHCCRPKGKLTFEFE